MVSKLILIEDVRVVFEAGDIVKCLPGFLTRLQATRASVARGTNPYFGGSGYEEGREFKVKRVSIGHHNSRNIVWPYKSGNGVYADTCVLVSKKVV